MEITSTMTSWLLGCIKRCSDVLALKMALSKFLTKTCLEKDCFKIKRMGNLMPFAKLFDHDLDITI